MCRLLSFVREGPQFLKADLCGGNANNPNTNSQRDRLQAMGSWTSCLTWPNLHSPVCETSYKDTSLVGFVPRMRPGLVHVRCLIHASSSFSSTLEKSQTLCPASGEPHPYLHPRYSCGEGLVGEGRDPQ